MDRPRLVKTAYSLAPHLAGYSDELSRMGYSPVTVGSHLCMAADLGRWLNGRNLKLRDLNAQRIAAFLRHRRRLPRVFLASQRGMGPLLEFLRRKGAVPPAEVDASPTGRFLADYRTYLVGERGLAATTVQVYTFFARQFIAEEHPQLDWRDMTPADVSRFVLRTARRLTPPGSKFIVTCLRALLRFLHVRAMTAQDLSSAVPAVASWRLSGIPKAIDASQVAQIFASFDRSPVGLRDAAIVRLAIRLGLRAGEIAALDLDDIDWRNGEMVVRGKNRYESRLPLPPDVGRTLAIYLRRSRPQSNTRALFLRSRAPLTRLAPTGVCSVARRALAVVGVRGGAHWFRHTAATQLLQHGADLSEIGHVLRHSSTNTTAIYAKVDLATLGAVVRPWQGGAL